MNAAEVVKDNVEIHAASRFCWSKPSGPSILENLEAREAPLYFHNPVFLEIEFCGDVQLNQ
jgi:hypothetical protein